MTFLTETYIMQKYTSLLFVLGLEILIKNVLLPYLITGWHYCVAIT